MTMDCRRFRESLDLYVDGELSVDAMAAADAHRRECAKCALAAREIDALRRAVRDTTESVPVPAGFEDRVRAALRLPTVAAVRGQRGTTRPWVRFAAAAMLLCAVGVSIAAARPAWLREPLVALMDRAVVQLAAVQPLVVEGTVLCRDCELQDRHGEQALCNRLGHRGALVTADGRIWNIMEQDSSLDLVRDEAMLGQRVRVQGTLYRDAGTIAVERYEIVRALTAGLPAPDDLLALR